MKDYIPTIGLEIHAELKTLSKMFCRCKNDPDETKPNLNVCPICMGHPGTIPVLNKEAIKHVLKIGYAVDGKIADFTEWDRKNYFYPDIPKGYQISQYKYPLVFGGVLSGVDLTRIHLEEDTAQSTHDTHSKSLINFNRSGVPLMELVTEPTIHDALTAVNFAKELKLLLQYIGAGEANLEKGEMRIEANISVASKEDTDKRNFGTKTEVKNLNSFKVVEKAINYEIKRQIELLQKGEKVVQETRGWDEGTSKTFSQRLKESSHDYRYFPEPDIPKVWISRVEDFGKEDLVKETPELPWSKRDRFIKQYGMTEKDVSIFIESLEMADYFEKVVKDEERIYKLATNYIVTDYLGLVKKEGLDVKYILPANFKKLMLMITENKLSSRGAKDTLSFMIKEKDNSKQDPEKIAIENNLIQKNNEEDLKKIVESIVSKNTSVVDDYKKGKLASLQFLIGQGMRETKGSANPELLKKLILNLIG